MSHVITNDINKKLENIAKEMREVMVLTHEKHIVTKEELEEMGFVAAEKLPNGKYKFNEASTMKDGRYLYHAPVYIAMNHFRALKKAFKKNSWAGCRAYILKINALP